MTNCNVTHNTAYGIYFGGGGGVAVDGSGTGLGGNATLTNCTISGNSVTASFGMGGGVANSEGTLKMVNTQIFGNSAATGGGVSTASGTTTMTKCSITGNKAGNGGGVSSVGLPFLSVNADGGYYLLPIDGTTTLTDCPGCITFDASGMRSQLISLTCSRPSIPPRSTNAPKSVTFRTVPRRVCTSSSSSSIFWSAYSF